MSWQCTLNIISPLSLMESIKNQFFAIARILKPSNTRKYIRGNISIYATHYRNRIGGCDPLAAHRKTPYLGKMNLRNVNCRETKYLGKKKKHQLPFALRFTELVIKRTALNYIYIYTIHPNQINPTHTRMQTPCFY